VIPELPAPTPRPSDRPSGSPRPLPRGGPLAPGRYSIPRTESNSRTSGYLAIDVTVPAGWALDGDHRIVKNPGGVGEVSFEWWVVHAVCFDPCHWTTSPVSPLDMDTHSPPNDGIAFNEAPAAGLLGQLDRVHSSPVETTIDGVGTVRIQLSIPDRLELSACDHGVYVAWDEDEVDPY